MAVSATSSGPELSVSIATAAAESVAPRPELFRFRIGKDVADDGSENIFRLHIEPFSYQVQDEVWHTSGEVSTDRIDGIALAACDAHLAAHLELAGRQDDDFMTVTRDAYRRLLRVIRQSGYPNLARVWNFFPGINVGTGDQERYKLFSAGRAVAFEEFGYTNEILPAGTAIGTDPGTPLTISVIATRGKCSTLENPRQISAYNYPKQYGPRSPKFSRAVIIKSLGGHKILISGTASIVGHESRHFDDPAQQLMETFRNLDELIRHAARKMAVQDAHKSALNSFWRVYIRPSAHAIDVERVLREHLTDKENLIILRGDICRPELQVEIEAACEI